MMRKIISQLISIHQMPTVCSAAGELAGVCIPFRGYICIKVMPDHSLRQPVLPRPIIFNLHFMIQLMSRILTP